MGLSRISLGRTLSLSGASAYRHHSQGTRSSPFLELTSLKPEPGLDIWQLVTAIVEEFKIWGIKVATSNKPPSEEAPSFFHEPYKPSITRAFLSIATEFEEIENLDFAIELDNNPAKGIPIERHLISWPTSVPFAGHDTNALLTLTIASILSSKTIGGQQLFDLGTYIDALATANPGVLKNTLEQSPKFEENIPDSIGPGWLNEQLSYRLQKIDICSCREQVKPELPKTIGLYQWSMKYFLDKVKRLTE